MKNTSHLFAYLKEAYLRRREPAYAVLFADALWHLLLLLALLAVIAAGFFGGWQFLSVLNEVGSGAPTQKTAPLPLDSAKLLSVLQIAQARAASFQSAASLSGMPDPYNATIENTTKQ